jgi:hypothetical protein
MDPTRPPPPEVLMNAARTLPVLLAVAVLQALRTEIVHGGPGGQAAP